MSAEAMPTAASPNAVAESIQHSQQSKSQRLRVSAGIAGIACRSRPHPRRLRLRGVDGRRHPRRGIRAGHPTVNRREHAHQPAEPQRRRRGCRAVCAAIRGHGPDVDGGNSPHHRLQVVTPSCATWRGLRPVAVPRGGGYDLAAGDTTSRRGLRPVAGPRGGGYDLAAGVAPPSATHTGRRESACPPPRGRIASKSPTVIIPRPLEGLISPPAKLAGGETTSRRELLLPPRLRSPATRTYPPPPGRIPRHHGFRARRLEHTGRSIRSGAREHRRGTQRPRRTQTATGALIAG